VGCGGTGGFVAEGLCRLFGANGPDILLIDHDRVEEHNLKRQNFYKPDIGKFKSQALAERFARLYGKRIGYSVMPFDPEMKTPMGAGMSSYTIMHDRVIGCVDDSTDDRRQMGYCRDDYKGNWLIDAGNGHHSGQVLIGNVKDLKSLANGFDKGAGTVNKLPMPTLQAPSLLISTAKEVPQPDCAEAVESEDQSPVINQAMATLILQFVHLLSKQKLTWMGAYIDLDTLQTTPVPAEPETIARMFSVKVDTLIRPEEPMCHIGRMSQMTRR